MKVYFWQNHAAHIQAPSLKRMAEIWPGDVHAVWGEEISPDRRLLGWSDPDVGGVNEILLTDDYRSTVQSIFKQSRDAVHIFSGLHAYPRIQYAHEMARAAGCPCVGVMVEPGIRMGWQGVLRPLRARWLVHRKYAHVRLVLAMGRDGVEFYRRAGFAPSMIFPYMYQSPDQNESFSGPQPSGDAERPLQLIYVGKFIARKGVDIMLRGLAQCDHSRWQLTIIGSGEEQRELQNLARRLNIESNLRWRGSLASSQVSAELARHDVCIVPSRFEGWGVVVNEALSSGLGVVCSDRVTSAELVQESGAGGVYAFNSPAALASKIRPLLEDSSVCHVWQERATQYRARIQPDVVGTYLAEVIEYQFGSGSIRPSPPWYVRQAAGAPN